jgi:hypothetical protein
MLTRRRGLLSLATATALALIAPRSGWTAPPERVRVQFEGDLQRYADLGDDASDRDQAVSDLSGLFRGLAAHLPPDVTLDIVVTDVNLAGELEWTRSGKRIRVMRDIGWPMIELRYVLQQGDRVLKNGMERVTDMAYLSTTPMGLGGTRFPYEERMLQRWVRGLVSSD